METIELLDFIYFEPPALYQFLSLNDPILEMQIKLRVMNFNLILNTLHLLK